MYKTSYNNLEAIYSSGKYSDPRLLFKVSICNFLGFKNIKKGYIEMTKKIYLETLKSVLGRSIFRYCNRVRVALGIF